MLSLLRRAWHAHVLFWGHNETGASARRNCVVLAPHPDDESIGMGATLARKIDTGSRVVIAVATDGRYSADSKVISKDELIKIRKAELLAATSHLGIKTDDIHFFDEEDTKINDERLKVKFNELLDSLDFDLHEIMSTSWNDSHQDHQACARVAKNAAMSRGIIFRGCPIYWWADGPTRFHRGQHSMLNRQVGKLVDLKRAFFSRGFVVDSTNFSRNRELAINEYESQVKNLTNEQTWSNLDPNWLAQFDRHREYFINQ